MALWWADEGLSGTWVNGIVQTIDMLNRDHPSTWQIALVASQIINLSNLFTKLKIDKNLGFFAKTTQVSHTIPVMTLSSHCNVRKC